jgi:hypothetical protein
MNAVAVRAELVRRNLVRYQMSKSDRVIYRLIYYFFSLFSMLFYTFFYEYKPQIIIHAILKQFSSLKDQICYL